MLPLVIALVLSQADAQSTSPDAPSLETDRPRREPELLNPSTAPPPDSPTAKPPPPRATKRLLLASGGAVAASAAALGLSLWLTGAFSTDGAVLDSGFATTMLAPLLLTGVGFSVHQSLGGRGEPILAYLAALALMAGAAGVSSAIDQTAPMNSVWTVALGTLPATAAAIWVLESTTRSSPRTPHIALTPTGFGLLAAF